MEKRICSSLSVSIAGKCATRTSCGGATTSGSPCKTNWAGERVWGAAVRNAGPVFMHPSASTRMAVLGLPCKATRGSYVPRRASRVASLRCPMGMCRGLDPLLGVAVHPLAVDLDELRAVGVVDPPPLAPSTSMLLRARVRVKRVLQNQKCSPGSRRGLTALSGVNHLDLRRDETPVRQGARVSDVPMVSSRNRTTARLPGETVTLSRYARSRAEVEFNWRRRLRSSCPRCTLGVPRRGPPA
jgi:hypothetical protein